MQLVMRAPGFSEVKKERHIAISYFQHNRLGNKAEISVRLSAIELRFIGSFVIRFVNRVNVLQSAVRWQFRTSQSTPVERLAAKPGGPGSIPGRGKFQYGVKLPCAAIRASKRRGMESKRDWICSWGNVPSRSLYANPQRVKDRCWRTMTNKLPTNYFPDMFNERHVWRTCRPGKRIPVILQRRLAQSSPHVAGHCPAEIWHVELPEGGAVLRALKHP
ncbi:hypothetical protein ANN_09800 [Periplaneta americana]|uniref:Uncharacterized protein n=1 Tax=Periplaneta americana TaxID=6978 RepID=A0ABQ8TMN2_PERAM|nr:hypothetical protein ANN_09800 [Periplaneta americana]